MAHHQNVAVIFRLYISYRLWYDNCVVHLLRGSRDVLSEMSCVMDLVSAHGMNWARNISVLGQAFLSCSY